MKRFLIAFSIAVFIGGVIAWFLFNKIVLADDVDVKYDLVSAFQVGVFSNYDNALRVAERNNGIVVSDDKLYRVFVAVLKDDYAIKVLKEYYDRIGLNYYLKDVSVSSVFVDDIKDYEKLLIRSNSESYSLINMDILKMYKEFL